VFTYEYADADKTPVKTKDYVVTVRGQGMDISQTKRDMFLVKFDLPIREGEFSPDNFEPGFVRVGTTEVVYIKTASPNDDFTEIELVTYTGIEDGELYELTYKDETCETPLCDTVTATNGIPTQLILNPYTAGWGRDTAVSAKLLDANNVLLHDWFGYDQYGYQIIDNAHIDFDIYIDSNDGYTTAKGVHFNDTARNGETAKVTVTYATGLQYQNGDPSKYKKLEGVITAINPAQITPGDFEWTVLIGDDKDPFGSARNGSRSERNAKVDDDVYAYIYLSDTSGIDMTHTEDYLYSTSHDDRLLVNNHGQEDKSPGVELEKGVRIRLTSVGRDKYGNDVIDPVNITVWDQDENFVKALPINIQAARYVKSIRLNDTGGSINLNLTNSTKPEVEGRVPYERNTVTVNLVDQYGDPFTDRYRDIYGWDALEIEYLGSTGRESSDGKVPQARRPYTGGDGNFGGNQITFAGSGKAEAISTYEVSIAGNGVGSVVRKGRIVVNVQTPFDGSVNIGSNTYPKAREIVYRLIVGGRDDATYRRLPNYANTRNIVNDEREVYIGLFCDNVLHSLYNFKAAEGVLDRDSDDYLKIRGIDGDNNTTFDLT